MTFEFEDRYAPNWPDTSRFTRQLAGDRCILCDAPAEETHHALYLDREGPIRGREIPGVHVFPLCHPCHQSDGGAHDSSSWYGDPKHPALKNHQAPSYYKKLRKAWVEKVHGLTIS
jgi:hypothetical protein